jgi:WD40 repeat protein
MAGDNGKLVAYGEDPPHTMADVIDLFGRARLLSFDLDPLTRTPTVEITHEALLREWPRLRNWLDDGRADVRTQRALAGAAAEWEKASRDPSFLLHGVRLSQLEGWAEETSLALTGEEREFLQSSLDQREAQRRAEEKRRAHLARLERRSRNVLRILVGVFAAAALVSILLSLFAFNQQRLATSRELAAVSNDNLGEDAELSMLLSLEALSIAGTREAEETLRRSLRTSRLRTAFSGHTGEVRSVTFSPDGSMIASSGRDENTVIVWETSTGTELARLPGIIARFSPDGRFLATGGGSDDPEAEIRDTSVYLWDTNSWQVVYTLEGHDKRVQDLHFNPQGTLLASASTDDTFIVWDTESGEQVFTGPAAVGGYDTLDNVAFSPDGKLFIAADYHSDALLTEQYSGMMRVYGVESDWALLNEYPSADMNFNLSPDGGWLVSPGESQFNAILLRDISGYPSDELATVHLAELPPVVVPEAHGGAILKFTFNQDSSLLATAGLEGDANIWSLVDEVAELLMTLAGHSGAVTDIAFSPDSRQVATAGADGTVRNWDITRTGISEGLALDAHSQFIRRFEFTQDGSLLATASFDGTAKLWDPTSGELLITVDDSDSQLMGVAISPGGNRLATAAFDYKARIYDLVIEPGRAKAELLHILAGHRESGPVGGLYHGVMALSFSQDGEILATGGSDGFVILWRVETGQQLWSQQVHPNGNGVTNLAFSPDSRYLATTSDQDPELNIGPLAKIWDVENGQELVTFEGHFESDRIWGLAFSPDGERLASSGSILKVWERSTGTEIFELSGHDSVISGLVFSTDGKFLASTSIDGTARLWDASTGEPIQRLFAPGPLRSAAFSPDGKYLVVSGDGFIYGFLLDREELVNQANLRLTRWFTPQECREYLHRQTCPEPPPGTRFASPAY